MKYFLHLAYNGGKYHGWQRQSKVSSVQATIEDNLRKLFYPELTIHGCGRTDAGVHATSYYAHFVVRDEIDFDLIFKLNRMLPDDIVIHDLIPVHPKANAQLDAIRRTYEYHIHLKKNPFLFDKSSCYDLLDLDLEKIAKAVLSLKGEHDFYHFCLQPELHSSTHCNMEVSEFIHVPEEDRIIFRFKADHFLRGMIRIIVGRLLDIGQNKISLEELNRSIQLKQPNKYMKQTYPQGLYLTDIEYDFDKIKL